MPKTLTDVSSWPGVAVPVGTDTATASSVETPLQLLSNRAKFLLEFLLSLRLRNWTLGHTSPVTKLGERGQGCYDPVAKIHDFVDAGGAASALEVISSAGHIWVNGTAPTDTAAGLVALARGPKISTDGLGNRAICGGVGGVWHSAARAAWSHGTAWGDSKEWCNIDHDGFAVWAVACDITTPALAQIACSTGPNVAWKPATTPPAFTSLVTALRHSRHSIGKLYATDPGNMVWLAMSTTESSYSTDADVWSAIKSHGLGAFPLDVAYSALGNRWICLCTDKKIGVSDDNGVTWIVGTPFSGSRIVGSIGWDGAIASDGLGGFVVAMQGSDGAALIQEVWYSSNGGETWTIVAPATSLTVVPANTAAWFGAGKFYVANNDASVASVFDIISSLGADEV